MGHSPPIHTLRVASSRHEHLTEKFSVDLSSETGLLEQVVVHSPGEEVALVSPENRQDLLFEDILFVGNARQEHLLMVAVCEKIIGRTGAVLELTALLRDAFIQEDARYFFIERVCRAAPERNLHAFEGDLKRLSPEELHTFALTGHSPFPIALDPVPNLMFVRDIAASVLDHVIVGNPANAVRTRESAIVETVLRFHPGFAATRDSILSLPDGVTFEGGDLIIADERVVLLGNSERTSFGGVMAIAQALFDRTPVEHVLMVDLPKARSCMHLDTVFTFVSIDECVVFPPLIDRTNSGNVVHFTRGDEPGRFLSQVRPNLKEALQAAMDRELTYIPCGGNEPLSQRREQWTDGANFFAVAPGAVVGYERNAQTFEAMRRSGYRIVSARGFLSYHSESEYAPGEKIAIKLEGTELSRGRGGPRCMTLPIRRGAA